MDPIASATNGAADAESDINSGAEDSGGFDQALADLAATFETAQIRNVQIRKLTTEEGTELNADKKAPNPV